MENIEQILKVLNEAGKAEKVTVSYNAEQDKLTAVVGDKVAKEVHTRFIKDLSNAPVACRIIQNKDKSVEVMFCNMPKVEDIIGLGGVVADFINKYFASAYVRKLISLPNIDNLSDLLTPQSGSGFVANPLTKPFNEIVKAITVTLKAKYPTKASSINANNVKGYIADSRAGDFMLGNISIKGKDITFGEYLLALLKYHCDESKPNSVKSQNLGVEMSPELLKQFAIDSLNKATAKKVEPTVDEDELEID